MVRAEMCSGVAMLLYRGTAEAVMHQSMQRGKGSVTDYVVNDLRGQHHEHQRPRV